MYNGESQQRRRPYAGLCCSKVERRKCVLLTSLFTQKNSGFIVMSRFRFTFFLLSDEKRLFSNLIVLRAILYVMLLNRIHQSRLLMICSFDSGDAWLSQNRRGIVCRTCGVRFGVPHRPCKLFCLRRSALQRELFCLLQKYCSTWWVRQFTGQWK